MALPSPRNLIAALAFAAALSPTDFGLAAGEPGRDEAVKSAEPADENPVGGGPLDRLSAHEFYTLAPFVVPVIDKGRHRKQFVLVVAIGLYDDEHREELRRLSPKMRNEIYHTLFRLVSFRTMEPRIPANRVLENRLTKIARRVAGDQLVKSLIVHSANVTDIR